MDTKVKHLEIHTNNSIVPLQRISDSSWCFVPKEDIPMRAKYEIKSATSHPTANCTITVSENFIHAKIEQQDILRYAISTQFPADSLPLYYRRSGFIHPITTRQGAVITDDFPEGHVHQHGMFHAWTRTFIQDTLIDFWNQHAQLGEIRHDSVLSVVNGPVFSSFSVSLDYLAYLRDDTLKVSNEIWNFKIYPLAEHYLMDWEIQHTWLGPDSLTIDEYHYGGTAFRGSSEWNLPEGAYDSLVFVETNLHSSHLESNHSRPEWITMYGLTDANQYAGITFIPSRKNFRYPQPVRVHPTMPYFCFAPMVLGKFVLQPYDVYKSNCRMLVFDGKPDYSLIQKIHESYQKDF
ncbi:MAG: hypothetical protein HKN76_06280 [Saprospiraceae bacterium]|nr:hypothetical protein [Saprospiraceae bacterium]